MNRLSRGNVQSIRARTLPAVLEMPPRASRIGCHRSKVVQMPSPMRRGEFRSPVVVEMPVQAKAPTAGGEDARLPADSEALYCGFRIAMMALVALLGWPHPTRDNDPGPAAAARPWRLERLSLVGRHRLTISAPFPMDQAAASAPIKELSQVA